MILMIYKNMIRPVITFGSETGKTEEDQEKIRGFARKRSTEYMVQ